MVRLTDEVLVTRLGRPSGFADESVTVIDPATGTGTFLLHVVDRIASADADYWVMATALGRRVIWAHTFGERCADADEDRPLGRLRLPDGPRLRVETGEGTHNRTLDYDTEQRELRIGDGVFEKVAPEVHAYEVSGRNVVGSWFNYRRAGTGGRNPDSLESITPDGWRPEWDMELLDVLNALTALVALEPEQAELLEAIIEGSQITVADLTGAEVLPVSAEAKKAPKVTNNPTPAQTLGGFLLRL